MSTLSSSPPRSLLYGQITDDFRQRILSGDLKPGERLPSFTEMRLQHRVSQATLNRVHSLLEAEGLISRRRGAGTFVCDRLTLSAKNGNGSGEVVSFLSNAVVILTPFDQPGASHRSGGWLEWIAQGAGDAVREAGMHAVSLHPDIGTVEIERLAAERPFGALIPAGLSESSTPLALMRRLRECGVATVAFGSSRALAECDHVLSDHESGAYRLTSLLLKQGKKRILNVQPLDSTEEWLKQRQAGYERAMKEAGLEAEPPLLVPPIELLLSTPLLAENPAPGFEISGEVLAQDRKIFESRVRALAGYFVEVLTGETPVEGLLATTDRDTFALAAICRLFGKEPNRDVLIVGYDNYFADCEECAVAPFVPFATVDKNNRALGTTMVQLLLDRINERLPDAPQARIIEPQIIQTHPKQA